ncbi:hypothetical protein N9C35_03045, partial [Flavobacteriaceae bacterium]|nr:hypothetical protein [Flavobacteriaceae bacterium]
MTVNQIRIMRDNEALFLFANKKPVMLYLKPYYKHYILNKLSQIKPLEPVEYSRVEENIDRSKNKSHICYM